MLKTYHNPKQLTKNWKQKTESKASRAVSANLHEEQGEERSPEKNFKPNKREKKNENPTKTQQIVGNVFSRSSKSQQFSLVLGVQSPVKLTSDVKNKSNKNNQTNKSQESTTKTSNKRLKRQKPQEDNLTKKKRKP